MVKQFALLVVIVFSVLSTEAAHIVGGDFSYRHISGDTYELKMKMYRDCGGGGASFEQFIPVGIYNKETNLVVKTISVPRVNIYNIVANTSCAEPSLRCVQAGIYITTFTMPKSQFHNSQGYYFETERCCRNDIILNIINPGSTPMAFYMEIPSPYPDSGVFIPNNSPEFTRDPLNYLCVGETFYYDFIGVDRDGDELRYSIGKPMAGGATSQFNPMWATKAKPYNDVNWMPGYGTSNYMDGAPDLKVQLDRAMVSVTPTNIGVYVISVICEEFRDGVKIGETRRELQLEVLECPPRFKPQATTSLTVDTVNALMGVETCFDILGSDLNDDELLRIRIDTAGIYRVFTNGASLNPPNASGEQNVSTEFCWTPQCPIDTGKGVFLDFIIYDNSCPFSQDDTVRVYFNINFPPNAKPAVSTSNVTNEFDFIIGQPNCFSITGVDPDAGDELTLITKPKWLNVFNLGASIMQSTPPGQDSLSAMFCWTPPCQGIDLSQPVYLDFIVFDNACSGSQEDTVSVRINLIVPPNDPPSIQTTAPGNIMDIIVGQQNCFEIEGLDVNPSDEISMVVNVYGQNVFAKGANLSPNIMVGNSQLINEFCWAPSCADLDNDDPVILELIIYDDACADKASDTVLVTLNLVLPANNNPMIITSAVNNTINVYPEQNVCVQIVGQDLDPADIITIDYQVRGLDVFSEGATLNPQIVVGSVNLSTEFCWELPCEGIDFDQTTYVDFIIYDNSCAEIAADTVTLTINLLAPQNDAPEVISYGAIVSNDSIVNLTVGVPNRFFVTGEDINFEDDIDVYYRLVNSDPFANGATWTLIDEIDGLKTYAIDWIPACDDAESGPIYLDFLIRDNKCANEKFDTTRMKLIIQNRSNILPEIVQPDSNLYHLQAGYPIDLKVKAIDLDVNDMIYLTAESGILTGAEAMIRAEFVDVQGPDSVETVLRVYPDCNLKSNQVYPINIVAKNLLCFNEGTVLRTINFMVNPLSDAGKPYIPNAFSPNGDGLNDYFRISYADKAICPGNFSIHIYDRWGKLKFHSTDTQFAWDGRDTQPGAYVYVMDISGTKISGFIAVVK